MTKKQGTSNQQSTSKQGLDYLIHLSVLRRKVGDQVDYISNLEITTLHNITRISAFNSYIGISGMRLLSRKQIIPNICGSLPHHHHSSMPSSRVVSVNFMINNGVATMEHYLREPETPFSKEFRIDTLIMVAEDLKEMGCNSVLTSVFIPGKNSSTGKDKLVLINIDKWIDYLRIYKSPSEFAKQSPL